MEILHNRWSWTHCLFGCDSGSPDAGVQKKEPEALKSCLLESDPALHCLHVAQYEK